MSEKNIIGIAGTNGAGKDTIGQILIEDYNFLFISVSDLLRSELKTQELEISRENLRSLSARWRRESGLGVLVDKAIDQFSKVQANYTGIAIASLRNPGEADRVHELGGKMIWVDAEAKLRYDRIQEAKRDRAGEDDKTFEQFLAEEKVEMNRSGDEATLSGADVKSKADIFLDNDGDITKLKAQLRDVI